MASLSLCSFTELNPYSNYSVFVEVCTRVGCSRSQEVKFKTLDDLPEGKGRKTPKSMQEP